MSLLRGSKSRPSACPALAPVVSSRRTAPRLWEKDHGISRAPSSFEWACRRPFRSTSMKNRFARRAGFTGKVFVITGVRHGYNHLADVAVGDLRRAKVTFALAAPTGRAQTVTESNGEDATTLHACRVRATRSAFNATPRAAQVDVLIVERRRWRHCPDGHLLAAIEPHTPLNPSRRVAHLRRWGPGSVA